MRILLTFLVGILSSSGLNAATDSQIKDFWFNGAEISRYQLNQARYGGNHPGHVEFIFVTEPFLTEQQVKQEFGEAPATPVLKLNALHTFNTGIYSYRTMTSTFRPVDYLKYPRSLKSNTSVQDWCGQAFQQFNRKPDGWHFELRSYFQKEGDQNRALSDAYLEDGLWVTLRLNPKALPVGPLQAIPGALYTRFAHKEVSPYKAKAELKSGPKLSTYQITYPDLSRTLKIDFDTQFPHIIRSWKETSPQGITTATLTHRIMNSTYWSEHNRTDAHKRKSLGLDPIAD